MLKTFKRFVLDTLGNALGNRLCSKYFYLLMQRSSKAFYNRVSEG